MSDIILTMPRLRLDIANMTFAELQGMTTIHSGHCENLKFESSHWQVWVSRMTIEDGERVNNEIDIINHHLVDNPISVMVKDAKEQWRLYSQWMKGYKDNLRYIGSTRFGRSVQNYLRARDNPRSFI